MIAIRGKSKRLAPLLSMPKPLTLLEKKQERKSEKHRKLLGKL
jgi:hypothetical protein